MSVGNLAASDARNRVRRGHTRGPAGSRRDVGRDNGWGCIAAANAGRGPGTRGRSAKTIGDPLRFSGRREPVDSCSGRRSSGFHRHRQPPPRYEDAAGLPPPDVATRRARRVALRPRRRRAFAPIDAATAVAAAGLDAAALCRRRRRRRDSNRWSHHSRLGLPQRLRHSAARAVLPRRACHGRVSLRRHGRARLRVGARRRCGAIGLIRVAVADRLILLAAARHSAAQALRAVDQSGVALRASACGAARAIGSAAAVGPRRRTGHRAVTGRRGARIERLIVLLTARRARGAAAIAAL